jgi:N-acetylmuramoyl-L-alanine amidase
MTKANAATDKSAGENSRTHKGLIYLAVLVALSCGQCVCAQVANFDRSAIFIDAAHGGVDRGAMLADQRQEKDITLEMAIRLRSILSERGFVVTMARRDDSDGGALDERAEMANRSHAVACLILHASASPMGVVVGTSALGTALMRGVGSDSDKSGRVSVWSRAQEPYAAQSGRLANQLGTALADSNIPVTIMRVVMRPLDNLTCAAVSLELGTRSQPQSSSTPGSYVERQQRIAVAIADALTRWRSEAHAPTGMPMPGSFEGGATP